MSSLFSYFRRRREVTGFRFVNFLWSDIYRGVEVGGKWIGWTKPEYKRRGW